MECMEARRLLDVYTTTLGAFHTIQEPLLTGLKRGDPEYNRARIDRAEAWVLLARARGMYWKHVQMHGCRIALSPPSRRKEIYAQLQTAVLEARRAFDTASREYSRLYWIAMDASGTADGAFVLQQAKRVHANAHEAYSRALERLTNFVTEGAIPDDVLE